jgi:hypothetical protein
VKRRPAVSLRPAVRPPPGKSSRGARAWARSAPPSAGGHKKSGGPLKIIPRTKIPLFLKIPAVPPKNFLRPSPRILKISRGKISNAPKSPPSPNAEKFQFPPSLFPSRLENLGEIFSSPRDDFSIHGRIFFIPRGNFGKSFPAFSFATLRFYSRRRRKNFPGVPWRILKNAAPAEPEGRGRRPRP